MKALKVRLTTDAQDNIVVLVPLAEWQALIEAAEDMLNLTVSCDTCPKSNCTTCDVTTFPVALRRALDAVKEG